MKAIVMTKILLQDQKFHLFKKSNNHNRQPHRKKQAPLLPSPMPPSAYALSLSTGHRHNPNHHRQIDIVRILLIIIMK